MRDTGIPERSGRYAVETLGALKIGARRVRETHRSCCHETNWCVSRTLPNRLLGRRLEPRRRDDGPDGLAVGEVPEPDFAVPAPRGERIAVGRDGERVDPVVMAGQVAQL